MTPFVRAMTAAAENRRAAHTLIEIAEADQFTAAILRANARGEDVSQFIPKAEPEPFDAKMAQAGERV